MDRNNINNINFINNANRSIVEKGCCSKVSELKYLWKQTPELQKLFGTSISFCVWYSKNIHPLANPNIEEVIKKAKKRFLCGNDRVKFKKRHNITRDK